MIKNIKSLFLIIFSTILISSCGSVQKALDPQNKNTSDEFLVEKKSPLVMPPDFNELPLPQQNDQTSKNIEEKDIRSLITDSKDVNENNQNSDQNTNFENSIIEKIKNN